MQTLYCLWHKSFRAATLAAVGSPHPLMVMEIELWVLYIWSGEQHCCFPAECFRTKRIPDALPVCMSHLVGKINGLPKTIESQQLASIMHLSVQLKYRSMCFTALIVPRFVGLGVFYVLCTSLPWSIWEVQGGWPWERPPWKEPQLNVWKQKPDLWVP